jgi:hypothetical protein
MDNIKRLALIFFVAISTFATYQATAVTINQTKLGPLYINSIGGKIVEAAFSNSFRSALVPWVGTAMMVGEVAKAIKIDYDDGRLDWLIPGRDNQPPAPSGWSDANTPPSSSDFQLIYTFQGKTYSTKNAAVDAAISWYNTSYDPSNPIAICDYGTSISPDYWTRSSSGSCINPTKRSISGVSNQCPSGYTLTNGACLLSNASIVKWPSDGIGTYQQDSSGVFKPNSLDSDNTTSSLQDQAIFKQIGTDSNGNPVSLSYKTTPDGGLDITRRLQGVDANGNPNVSEEITHFNNLGHLTNIYNNTYNNTYITEPTTSDPPPTSTSPSQTDCDKYPDSLGCSKYGTPSTNETISNKEMPNSISPLSFGSSGSCPNDLTTSFLGQPLSISYSSVCQFASGLKTVILVIGAFLGLYIAFGFSMGGKS